jgi:recombinase
MRSSFRRHDGVASGVPAIHGTALELARAIAPVLSELGGMSAQAAAAELNARQVETPSGAPWSARTVIRIRESLAAGRESQTSLALPKFES